jgi:hypothetical protein
MSNGITGHKRMTATVATGGSLTTAINIAGFNSISIEAPLFSSGCVTATANIKCLVARNATDTFRVLKAQGVYSAGSGILDWEVPSTTGNYNVVNPHLSGFNLMKIQISNTCTANCEFVIHAKN